MFDNLITLYLEEKKQYKQSPKEYSKTVDNFYSILEEKNIDLKYLDTLPDVYSGFWINFYLAWAIKLIQISPKGEQLDYLPSNRPDTYTKKYYWTACMILGMILPDKKFGSEAFSQDFPEERGYFSRFSSDSLYERVFKDKISTRKIRYYLYHTSVKKTQLKRIEEEKIDRMRVIISLNEVTTDLKTVKNCLDDSIFRYLKNNKSSLSDADYDDGYDNGCDADKDVDDYSDYGKWYSPPDSVYPRHAPNASFTYSCNYKEAQIRGLNINYREKEDGSTLLILAVIEKKYLLAEHLLNLGADPLVENYNTEVASDLVPLDSPIFTTLKGYELLYATFNGDLEKIKSIIHEGADVDFQGFDGYTALMIAVEQNFIELIEVLLESGADINLLRSDGQGVFELVNDEEIFNILNTAILPMLEELGIDEEHKDEVLEEENQEEMTVNSPKTPITSLGFFSGVPTAMSSQTQEVQKIPSKKINMRCILIEK